ncbi:hypothetical protein L596_020060 [Steinernema carpocapsae]|uniref:Uncharacterized protein n=1 Tax=Steinernema carpocapsae TaxID=34508 RepID=A0A4U5MT85_STECR|nr:hypothetical protein L596_020060 [Steinernema carpocapsae]
MDDLPIAFCESAVSQLASDNLIHVAYLDNATWSKSSTSYQERSSTYIFALMQEPGSNELHWNLLTESQENGPSLKLTDLNPKFAYIKTATFYGRFIERGHFHVSKASEKLNLLKLVWAYLKEDSEFACMDEEVQDLIVENDLLRSFVIFQLEYFGLASKTLFEAQNKEKLQYCDLIGWKDEVCEDLLFSNVLDTLLLSKNSCIPSMDLLTAYVDKHMEDPDYKLSLIVDNAQDRFEAFFEHVRTYPYEIGQDESHVRIIKKNGVRITLKTDGDTLIAVCRPSF